MYQLFNKISDLMYPFYGDPALSLIVVLSFVLLGSICFALSRRYKRGLLWVLPSGLATFSWLAYFIYENAMKSWERTVIGAPIRIDLLAIYPALILISIIALGFSIFFFFKIYSRK